MVKVEIEGCVIDEAFARILVNNRSLTLPDVMLLDKVQKHKSLKEEEIVYLRKKKFVEGRKNNLFLSSRIATVSQHVGLKSSYIKNRSFDDEYFKKLIYEYINKFGRASRKEIDDLLLGKLSENLTPQQKRYKITNLLTSLRTNGKIRSGERRMWYPVK